MTPRNIKTFNKLAFAFLLLFLFSCKPVNYFTRVERTPRAHTMNYCGENIRSPKSEYQKETWVVFSDRANNASYRSPGGKVKLKEYDFMDAFLVLKKKGEYYQLIKYDPAIIENLFTRRLKDRKKAEYCGWIHESNLLLTRQSVTDIYTGFKNKQLTIIADSFVLNKPELFLATDSLFTFEDADLLSTNNTIPFYSVVYPLKDSRDNKKTLIARNNVIDPENAKDEVLGWVPKGLIKTMGQRLYADLQTLPKNSLHFSVREEYETDTIAISLEELDRYKTLSRNEASLKYDPVVYYRQNENHSVTFRPGIVIPAIDNKNNYILNVNGDRISYSDIEKSEKDLRQLNIVFVLEGQRTVIQNYTEIINVIQNLQTSFEQHKDTYSFKFGAVLTSQGSPTFPQATIKSSGLVNNYTHLMDFMTIEGEKYQRQSSIPNKHQWSGLRKAVEVITPYKNETNIMVLIGETGHSEWADSTLVNQIAEANCRILGFQMHGNKEESGNNFVLQVENMIDNSAKKIALQKREKIVYVDQIKPRNLFKEHQSNVFSLDFPERSMTQGWVIFPKKGDSMAMNILSESIEALVDEVIADNENLIYSFHKALSEVGHNRSNYNKFFALYNKIDYDALPSRDFLQRFDEKTPIGYITGQREVFLDSLDKEVDYSLLLSENELSETLQFLNELSIMEVDYKYKGAKKKQTKRCDCPDDEDLYDYEETYLSPDSEMTREYQNTKKIRKHLYNAYMDLLTNCKVCKTPKKKVKEYSLSKAHQLITGSPTYTPLLEKHKIKDLKKKQLFTDEELDLLINYFKETKEALIRQLPEMDKFESNGEIYYWIDADMLP